MVCLTVTLVTHFTSTDTSLLTSTVMVYSTAHACSDVTNSTLTLVTVFTWLGEMWLGLWWQVLLGTRVLIPRALLLSLGKPGL